MTTIMISNQHYNFEFKLNFGLWSPVHRHVETCTGLWVGCNILLDIISDHIIHLLDKCLFF